MMQQLILTTMLLSDQTTNHHFKVSVKCWSSAFVRAYYGMEWKEKIGMEYGMAQVWNGMEDLMYGMERNVPYSMQIPYLHILTQCCWSPVFRSL